jgi:formylglycine-generating enzyme
VPLRHRRTALSLLLLVPLLSGCPGQPKGAGDGSSPAPEEKPPSGKTAAGSATAPARPGEPDASIAIPSGTFVLGGPDFEDERSGRSIMLGSFAIDRHEVSLGAYRSFLEAMKKDPSHARCSKLERARYPDGKDHRPSFLDTDRYRAACPTDKHPVVWVDWFDASSYAAWAGKRLPSECEWERAASWDRTAQRKRLYPWGDRAPGARGVYLANFKPLLGAGLDGFLGAAPVTSYPRGASSSGALNLAGNVAEWCADWYRPSYSGHTGRDPRGPDTGIDKVLRGGSYDSPPEDLRTTRRLAAPPELRQPFIGFRCAR